MKAAPSGTGLNISHWYFLNGKEFISFFFEEKNIWFWTVLEVKLNFQDLDVFGHDQDKQRAKLWTLEINLEKHIHKLTLNCLLRYLERSKNWCDSIWKTCIWRNLVLKWINCLFQSEHWTENNLAVKSTSTDLFMWICSEVKHQEN